MIALYTVEEFGQAGCDQLLPLECQNCRGTFFRAKHDIQSALTCISGKHREDFCSRSCKSQTQFHGHQPVNVMCKQCGVTFSKAFKEVKKSPNHFCHQSCAAQWSNAHKTKGTRRSKLEVWLETQLTALYPNLGFHFNKTDAIEAELDIYIPSLKLAFELNGIFHYEPIYGTDKLTSIHKNDHRKILACAEHGIELCILDVSKMKYFKENNAQPFLQIVQGVLDHSLLVPPARFERATFGFVDRRSIQN